MKLTRPPFRRARASCRIGRRLGPDALRFLEVVESGGTIAFEDSRWIRPGQFLPLPEAGRGPRTWLNTCDLLIVDSPPLTESSTRCWVPRTHGVVLVVDGEKAGVGAVQQARDESSAWAEASLASCWNRYRLRVPDYLR